MVRLKLKSDSRKRIVEIPAQEVWLLRNKDSLAKVKRGLSQKGTVKRGSFAKYSKDDV
jgi:hypothetical protein